jgi:hypothetical protein
MRILEFISGAVIGLLTFFVLILAVIFSVGSMGRYLKAKSM